jgi:chaperonin GroEL (HSP60 family)
MKYDGSEHRRPGRPKAALQEGIVSPRVVRTALENAVSVASVLLLTEATLTEIPEPTTEAGRMHPDGLQ